MTDEELRKLVRLRCNADRTEATLVLRRGIPPELLTPQLLDACVAERGLSSRHLDPDALEALRIRYLNDPTAEHHGVIATGVPPVQGEDGRIAFEERFTQRREEAREDDQGRRDHYSRSAFIVVGEGELLGTFHPPTAGTDGEDVFGRPIRAEPGKKLAIDTDSTIAIDEAGPVRTTMSGRLVKTPVSLRVTPSLEIDESVDFSTGNVDFPGDVTVHRGIKDCFTVRVGGSLAVSQLVEAAHLHVLRDAQLQRGMAGRDKGTICVGRDLHARYLDAVHGTVGRDARIDRELNNCTLRIGRRLDAPRAVCVGGALEVGGGATLAQLGSSANVPTRVVIGRVGFEDAIERGGSLVANLRGSLVKAERRLNQLRDLAASPDQQQGQEIADVERQFNEAAERLVPLREALRRALEAVERSATYQLVVQKELYPEVVIVLGTWRCAIREPLRGPLEISLDGGSPIVRDLRTGSTTALRDLAAVERTGALDADHVRNLLDAA